MTENKKISFLDLLIILLERKWVIVISVVVLSAGGLIVSTIMTKYYTATATILKPKQKLAGGLGSLLGDLPLQGLLKNMDVLGGSDEDQFLNILESRRMADQVIDRFNLIHRYKFDKQKLYYRETVVKAFHKNMQIVENKYDNIELSFTDSSPEFSAQVVNYIIAQLDSINFNLARESARNSKLFFAERLNLIKADLDSASRRFAEYQTTNNFIDLDQQVKSSIDALAQFDAQKLGLDLQIQQIKSQFGSNSERARELQKNRSVVEERLNHYMNEGDNGLIVALKKAPQSAVEYGYLYRDVKVQEALYQFVLQLFEQAKFAEANNTPTVQVLEWAVPPQKKTKPKRAIFCILCFFSGLALSCVYVLYEKWFRLQKSNNSQLYMKLIDIRRLLFRLR